MPPLSIKLPRPETQPISSIEQQQQDTVTNISTPSAIPEVPAQEGASPIAPQFSPITPKIRPAIPTVAQETQPTVQDASSTATANTEQDKMPSQTQDPPIAPAQYVPRPTPLPFSSADSTDAIALRAAISTLQFQKQKAQQDVRKLQKIRNQALSDPLLFKNELAAGRLKEKTPRIGDLRAVLDHTDSDEDEEKEDAVGQAAAGASSQEVTMDTSRASKSSATHQAEIPDSQPSRPASSSALPAGPGSNTPPAFEPIPGPQKVVRMPHINWDKYHIAGDALDSIHEQQRRWPGNFAYGQERGREHVVAAPYSPWLDSLDGQQRWELQNRKDSAALSANLATPTGTVSEHPMETRRGSKQRQP